MFLLLKQITNKLKKFFQIQQSPIYCRIIHNNLYLTNYNLQLFYQEFIFIYIYTAKPQMKKTKQTFFRPLPTEQQNVGISGCKQFEGEDLKYDSRRQFFKNKQKQWLDQQIEEKRQRDEQQKYQNQLYSNQTQELNRMRGMLQDNFQQTKCNIVSDLKKTNQQLDLQRKQRQRLDKEARLQHERQEAENLKQRGAKQGFYMQV